MEQVHAGQPVNDFQVKVWYWSGSAETVSHIDFMAAASIYSEACDNPRARAAEVHCPGGCLAASFVVETDPNKPCGKRLRALSRPFSTWAAEEPLCVLLAGHKSPHVGARTSTRGQMTWEDHECVTELDTSQDRG